MIGLVGYNFLCDGNAIDAYPTNVTSLNSILIENAEYDELYVTRDAISPYSTDVPTDWDIYTVLLANFENTLSGGNLDAVLSQLDAIRIKRRRVGEYDWVTLAEIPIVDTDDLNFSGEDLLASNGIEYEYAWVPVLSNTEGNYIIEGITSNFRGVYVCDAEAIYKFSTGVKYGASQQTQQVGVFNPLGKKYPIYVTNGMSNYQTGSITGDILGNYEETGVFNRTEMVLQKDALLKFLTNKKAKLIKDDNGNQWLCMITGNPSVQYNSSWGNGMMTVSFEYGEVGDAENQEDLANVGLVPTIDY